MRLRTISAKSGKLKALEAINEEAIPENERCSLSDMLATGAEVLSIEGTVGKMIDETIEKQAIEESDEPVGFIAIRCYRNLVYLAYFAVRKDLRSNGIGSTALRKLIDMYPGKMIVAEYEAPDLSSPNHAVRIRRKQFYLKNGFFETGWHTCYDGTEFEICCSRPVFDADGFKDFSAYISTVVSDHIPNPFPVTAP